MTIPSEAILLGTALLIVSVSPVQGQVNYEIQIYPSETVAPGNLMLELHSNFTFNGEAQTVNGVFSTDHALHETFELTYGFTPWFETGFYVFTSARSGEGWQWVGDHVRPRVRAPESWRWPVGVSLSTEFGYQRRNYSEDTWTWEIRPIVDKKLGPWYFSLNPTFEKSVHGVGAARGWEFSPNAKVSYDVSRAVALGVEYYGSLGPVSGFDPAREQQHQIVPSIDLNVSPKWELNFGTAIGLTSTTDRFLIKVIVGRRLDF